MNLLSVFLSLQDDLPAQALLDVAFARLNLIETCYFGLRFVDQDGQTVSILTIFKIELCLISINS